MEELWIDVAGARLAATWSGGGALTVIALHGSEPGTRDGPLYQHLHRVLPEVGIGVLTFDRRGEGLPGGRRSKGDFAQQAQDCTAIIERLAPRRVVSGASARAVGSHPSSRRSAPTSPAW